MIFPGIYSEYEDTDEAKATVKVRTQKSEAERRASFREESRKDEVQFNGKYNVADERTAPTYKPNNSLNFGKLAPVKKPQGFVVSNQIQNPITLPSRLIPIPHASHTRRKRWHH